MSEETFQISSRMGKSVICDFGSRTVIQLAKNLEPGERLTLDHVRFRCTQPYFKVNIQFFFPHGTPIPPSTEYWSENIGGGDEKHEHVLVENTSDTIIDGTIMIYFHAETPTEHLDGPQEINASDSIWCQFTSLLSNKPAAPGGLNMG